MYKNHWFCFYAFRSTSFFSWDVFCSICCLCTHKIKQILSFNTNSMPFLDMVHEKRSNTKVRSSYGPLAYFYPMFSFLAKILSFLLRNDNIFARNLNIGKICKRTITWTDFKELLPRKVLISVDITFNSYTKLSEKR